MKRVLNYIKIAFILSFVASCTGKLEVGQKPLSAEDASPIIAFEVRSLTGKDSVLVGEKMAYEGYIKQVEFYQPRKTYKVKIAISGDAQGAIYYNDKEYRNGDWISMDYDELRNNDNVFYFTFKQYSTSQLGKDDITFTCTDNLQTQSVSKTLTIYDIDRTVDAIADPSFNYKVRGFGPDSLGGGENLVFENYLRQQNTYKPYKRYQLIITQSNVDGNITYKGKPYRAGDVILLDYDEILSNSFVANLTYKVVGVVPKSTATITLTCTDTRSTQSTAISFDFKT